MHMTTGIQRRKLGAIVVAMACAWIAPRVRAELPDYDATLVGLTDAEHTGTNGLRSTDVLFLQPTGVAAGTSARYNGGSIAVGESAWIYQNGNVLRLGF